MELEATSETTIMVRFSGPQAIKTVGSLSRVLTAIDKLSPEHRTRLVNTGTVDDLLALRTAMQNVMP